jgi:hypothetical protein
MSYGTAKWAFKRSRFPDQPRITRDLPSKAAFAADKLKVNFSPEHKSIEHKAKAPKKD